MTLITGLYQPFNNLLWSGKFELDHFLGRAGIKTAMRRAVVNDPFAGSSFEEFGIEAGFFTEHSSDFKIADFLRPGTMEKSIAALFHDLTAGKGRIFKEYWRNGQVLERCDFLSGSEIF